MFEHKNLYTSKGKQLGTEILPQSSSHTHPPPQASGTFKAIFVAKIYVGYSSFDYGNRYFDNWSNIILRWHYDS